MRIACVNKATNIVDTVIEVEDLNNIPPVIGVDNSGKILQATDYTFVQSDTAGIGYTYANGTFTPPKPNTPQPTFQELQTQMLKQLQAYASAYLSQTDYVVIKKAEGVALSTNDQNALTTRAKFREWYATTKQAIQNATSQNELDGISLIFGG